MTSGPKKIRVQKRGIPLLPCKFTHKKKKHQIMNILHQWQEYGFDPNEEKTDWSATRCRRYFHVQTKEEQVFEIFEDISDHSADCWYFVREIDEEKA